MDIGTFSAIVWYIISWLPILFIVFTPIVALALYFYIIKTFNVKCTVVQEFKGGNKACYDKRAKLIYEAGITKIMLFSPSNLNPLGRNKEYLKMRSLGNFLPLLGKKGFKLFLFKDENGHYHDYEHYTDKELEVTELAVDEKTKQPILNTDGTQVVVDSYTKRIEKNYNLKPSDEDDKAFLVYEDEAARKKLNKQAGFLQKYGYLIATILIAIVLIVMIIFSFDYAAKTVDKITSVASQACNAGQVIVK